MPTNPETLEKVLEEFALEYKHEVEFQYDFDKRKEIIDKTASLIREHFCGEVAEEDKN